MHSFLLISSGLLASFILYSFVSSFLTTRRNARRAAELGCKPAWRRQHKWPLGVDFMWRMIKADRACIVPNDMLAVYTECGKTTWEQLLVVPNFVTVDPKNIQAILATQFNDFAIGELRRKNFFPMFGNGIFTSDGKSWEHSRALLRPQFARQQVADLELEEVHVQDLFRHLATDSNGWTGRVNLSPLFFRLTLDSATEFLFGESVDSQLTALPDGGAHKKKSGGKPTLDWTAFGPAFDGGTDALGKRGRLSEIYFLYSPASFHRNCKTVHEFADYYVHRALRNSASESPDVLEKGETKKKYVFLDELVKATRDPIELRSQLLNILLAGRDTTAGLLGWTFWNLARDPERFQKLREIILKDFGPYSEDTSKISFETLKACTYLQHTLNEVLRIFPTVPLNSRRAVKDTTLPRGGGPDGLSPVFIPKGCEVNYTVHVMHHRKDLWGEDADEFRPERWAGRKPGWEYLPFNGGPRICLGQQFALTEAGYVIVRMLQRFDQIENLDPEMVPKHFYTVTTSAKTVELRLHEAKR